MPVEHQVLLTIVLPCYGIVEWICYWLWLCAIKNKCVLTGKGER